MKRLNTQPMGRTGGAGQTDRPPAGLPRGVGVPGAVALQRLNSNARRAARNRQMQRAAVAIGDPNSTGL